MIELVIEPRQALLPGDMKVNRVLPFRARRRVGPFVFLDHMVGDTQVDIGPHPHIGLATVTYLFEGEVLHRDSLGSVQKITPRDLNWMTAGRGIVHSERGSFARGVQAWVALPLEFEESEPSFQHFVKRELPVFSVNGCAMRLIAGSAYGYESPVRVHSELFYLEAEIPSGETLEFVPSSDHEAAFYIARGEVLIQGKIHQGPRLIVFKKGESIRMTAVSAAHGLFLGGKPLEGERWIWWNFLSSSKERIEEAKRLWKEQDRSDRFPLISGDTQFIPLPEESK